jgi:hypothetical protein
LRTNSEENSIRYDEMRISVERCASLDEAWVNTRIGKCWKTGFMLSEEDYARGVYDRKWKQSKKGYQPASGTGG